MATTVRVLVLVTAAALQAPQVALGLAGMLFVLLVAAAAARANNDG